MSTVAASPIVELLDYQKRAVQSSARFTWNNWSRQTGKSFSFGLKRMLRGIERRRNQILLSAGERQSKELMDKVQMHAKALKIANDFHSNSFEGASFKQLELVIPAKCRVIALPANPMTARGFTGDVLLDEFAMHQDDREIWGALFPTVMRGAGELDICSTPKGPSNMFARLRTNPQFEATTLTIHDAIADGLDVDPEVLRQTLNDDDLWQQEFLCEFLDENLAFLTYEQIAACEDQNLELPFGNDQIEEFLRCLRGLVGNGYLGLDIGRHRDLTVFWLLEECENRLITRGVLILRGVPFREQYAVLHECLASHKVRRCCIDAGGLGMPLAEAAVECFGSYMVEPVTFTLQSKEEMANGLRMKVEDVTIRIPLQEAIRNDWHSIRRIALPGGRFKYQGERTPEGHADRFWAAALAVRAARANCGSSRNYS